MKYLDLTFPSPEENLACDEALIDQCEVLGGPGVLRFWESQRYFVVVGYSNRNASEVNLEACRLEGILCSDDAPVSEPFFRDPVA